VENTNVTGESNITERGQNLLPCPFCGDSVEMEESKHDDGSSWFWVECDCGIDTRGSSNCKDMVTFWNRRAKPGGENPFPQQPHGEK